MSERSHISFFSSQTKKTPTLIFRFLHVLQPVLDFGCERLETTGVVFAFAAVDDATTVPPAPIVAAAPGVVAVAVGVESGAEDDPPDPSIGLSIPAGWRHGTAAKTGARDHAHTRSLVDVASGGSDRALQLQ